MYAQTYSKTACVCLHMCICVKFNNCTQIILNWLRFSFLFFVWPDTSHDDVTMSIILQYQNSWFWVGRNSIERSGGRKTIAIHFDYFQATRATRSMQEKKTNIKFHYSVGRFVMHANFRLFFCCAVDDVLYYIALAFHCVILHVFGWWTRWWFLQE